MRRFPVLAPVLLLPLVAGCSGMMQRMAVAQTAAVLKRGRVALEREWDYELAAAAIAPNIKMAEAFLETDPENRDLLEMSAMVYASYGLVVLADQYEEELAKHDGDETPRSEHLRGRLKEMFLRAHRYGLRLLGTTQEGARAAYEKGREALDAMLARCDKEDVPGLFFTAMPLAQAIDYGRDDIELIALLPKVKAIARRVAELDERFFNAGAHLVLGAMLGGLSKAMGGDPKAAREHFDRALELTGRSVLLIHVMYAKTLAVQTQDRALFGALLKEVLDADLAINPRNKLINVVAKRKARRLLAQADELF